MIIDDLKVYNETVWINPVNDASIDFTWAKKRHLPTLEDIENADQLLRRFSKWLNIAFPDTQDNNGLLESPITKIDRFQTTLITFLGGQILGNMWVKRDDMLPVSGSIKARGGIYEVLVLAERIAISSDLLTLSDDYSKLSAPEFKRLFSQYTIVVGSTGNLGISVGIVGKKLGFNVTVYMSNNATKWKVNHLRSLGVDVVLSESNYTGAVDLARKHALDEENTYFVDDENSMYLFEGYAVAGLRLKQQLIESKISVDAEHPLFVYLPCGVGSAPSAISYVLKLLYGEFVHIFIAEPTHAPAVILALSSEKDREVDIKDFGIDGITRADGLAVGKCSKVTAPILAHTLSGGYTISDEKLIRLIYLLSASENINLEPSAIAGFLGPAKLFYDSNGFNYLKDHNLLSKMDQSTHLLWATGGGLVPTEIMDNYILEGQSSPIITL